MTFNFRLKGSPSLRLLLCYVVVVFCSRPGGAAFAPVKPFVNNVYLSLNPPAPAKTSREIEGLTDQTLGFGEMSIGAGKAFSVDAAGDTTGQVPVSKSWTPLNGRNFLIEEVRYEAVAEQLQKLPIATKYKGASLRRRGTGENVIAGLKKLLPKRYAKAAPKPGHKQMAQATPQTQPGFVMDYVILNTSQNNYTFKGDTTYYVTALVNLTGTTTIEGGAVVKFNNSSSAKINLSSGLYLKTGAYRPAIFTSMYDNSVGETVSSAQSPATLINVTFLENIVSGAYLHFRYAGTAVGSPVTQTGPGQSSTSEFRHCQFVKCGQAIAMRAEGQLYSSLILRNVLFAECPTAVYYNFTSPPPDGSGEGYLHATLLAENVTADGGTSFWANYSNMADYTYFFTTVRNCLFTRYANPVLTAMQNAGNGYEGSFDNANNYERSDALCYQPSVGAGNYYLAVNPDGSDASGFRNLGTANIDPTLLAELQKKTTYPPELLSGTLSGGATTLSQRPIRDTNVPDLGYHYDPLDYLLNNVAVAGPTLTLINGVAVSLIGSSGVSLNGSSFVSTGTPTGLNHVVRPHCVQEQSLNQGAGGFTTQSYYYPTLIRCRFTEFVGYGLFLGGQGAGLSSQFVFRDCQLHNFPISVDTVNTDPDAVASVFLTNNIIDRCALFFNKEMSGATYAAAVELDCYNNLFRGGSFYYSYTVDGGGRDPQWQLKDNLCDEVALSVGNQEANYVHVSHNGFTTSTANPWGGTGNLINLQRDYQTGPLGNYYYPSTGGSYSLFNLINVGSRIPAQAGLYHYTVKTAANSKEGTDPIQTVDIGFHFAATDANGNPTDTDGDGLADYLDADSDNNGMLDEVEFQYFDRLGTLQGHVIGQMTQRINGLDPNTAQRMYVSPTQLPPNNNTAPNPGCWLSGVTGFSSFSPFHDWVSPNQCYWYQGGGTLITPRHAITVDHQGSCFFQANQIVRFVDINGVPHDVRCLRRQTTANGDICVLVFDQDLPSNVQWVKVLPTTVTAKLSPTWGQSSSLSGRLPAIGCNQLKHAYITDIWSFGWGATTLPSLWFPTWGARCQPNCDCNPCDQNGGDSGSPMYLVINNELILVGAWDYCCTPTRLGPYVNEVNSVITALDVWVSQNAPQVPDPITGYTVTVADLSSFPDLQ